MRRQNATVPTGMYPLILLANVTPMYIDAVSDCVSIPVGEATGCEKFSVTVALPLETWKDSGIMSGKFGKLPSRFIPSSTLVASLTEFTTTELFAPPALTIVDSGTVDVPRDKVRPAHPIRLCGWDSCGSDTTPIPNCALPTDPGTSMLDGTPPGSIIMAHLLLSKVSMNTLLNTKVDVSDDTPVTTSCMRTVGLHHPLSHVYLRTG